MTVYTPAPAERSPETFHQAMLVAQDFDGTVALTFEPSPNNLDVHVAYEVAIGDMFGGIALHTYLEAGGLQNRAPLEVVRGLVPDAPETALDILTTELVDRKLSVLLSEVGARYPRGGIWPRLTDGYRQFHGAMTSSRQAGCLVDDIIISSGHVPFISKVFEVHDLEQPLHILAEETMRGYRQGASVDALCKPSPLLMDTARQLWRGSYGVENEMPEEANRVLYIGDDLEKDMTLAERSHVAFMLLEPARSAEAWQTAANYLGIARYAGKVAT